MSHSGVTGCVRWPGSSIHDHERAPTGIYAGVGGGGDDGDVVCDCVVVAGRDRHPLALATPRRLHGPSARALHPAAVSRTTSVALPTVASSSTQSVCPSHSARSSREHSEARLVARARACVCGQRVVDGN